MDSLSAKMVEPHCQGGRAPETGRLTFLPYWFSDVLMAEKHPLKVLADYRAAAGKTQADLAQDLGVAPMTVSRWETGDRKIGVKTLSEVSRQTGLAKRELRPDLAESMQEALQ